jgi:hypothetical protein
MRQMAPKSQKYFRIGILDTDFGSKTPARIPKTANFSGLQNFFSRDVRFFIHFSHVRTNNTTKKNPERSFERISMFRPGLLSLTLTTERITTKDIFVAERSRRRTPTKPDSLAKNWILAGEREGD